MMRNRDADVRHVLVSILLNADRQVQDKMDDKLHLQKVIFNRNIMKIKLSSIFVEDQEKALEFYTKIIGFVKKSDISMWNYRWLTVVSPNDMDWAELVLEPNENPAAKTFQKALHDQVVPMTALMTDDIEKEYDRLKELWVEFKKELSDLWMVKLAIFDDTCGNLIQIYEPAKK